MRLGRAAARLRGAWAVTSAGLGLLSVACRSDPWVIASEWSPEHADAGARTPRDASPDTEACPTAATLDAERAAANPASSVDVRHAGLWRGTLGGGAVAGFPSAQVELRVANDGPSSLRFGVAAEAPSPLDPSRGYLCAQSPDGVHCATPSGYVAGFVYPLEALTSRGDVLSFRIVVSDPWSAWCRLQSPQAWPDSTQRCGFGFGAGPRGSDGVGAAGCARVSEDGTVTALDCELMYALQHCACATDACVARAQDAMDVGLKLSDGQLVGSLWYEGDLDAASVRLSRQ